MTRFLIAALGVAGCASPHSYVVPVLEDAASFTIEVEGSTGPGRVTDAVLEGDSLVVGYTYPAPEGSEDEVEAGHASRNWRKAGVTRS